MKIMKRTMGKCLVGVESDQDIDEIIARLKETPRWKMVGADALRASLKSLIKSNLLNVANEKENLPNGSAENGSMGKRNVGDGKEKSEGEPGFIRRLMLSSSN